MDKRRMGVIWGRCPKAFAELESAAAETVLSREKVIASQEIERETDPYREREIRMSSVTVEPR